MKNFKIPIYRITQKNKETGEETEHYGCQNCDNMNEIHDMFDTDDIARSGLCKKCIILTAKPEKNK